MKECPRCKKVVDRVPLTMLVYTWEPEPVEGDDLKELQETAWHKKCFVESFLDTEESGKRNFGAIDDYIPHGGPQRYH